MAWSFGTSEVLSKVRAAIGPSTTVGSTTFTWKTVAEGPLLRWLDDKTTDYPAIILDLGDGAAQDQKSKIRCIQPLTVWVVVQSTAASATGISPKVYEMTRLLGEAVLASIMNTGPRLGSEALNDRALVSWGVDKEATGEFQDRGLCIYRGTFEIGYYVNEVQA